MTKTSKTEPEVDAAEAQIRELQTVVDYDTKEYPVGVIVDKYTTGLDDDTNELFVPDYQRALTWTEKRQSKFIESVLIGLPIPYIFVADVGDDLQNGGRLEIVDGSQRIRSLKRYLTNELRLTKLEKLTLLKDTVFSDLSPARQRRFKRRTLRMIELSEKASEEVRRDIFERINTGSDELKDMEKRRGIQQGPGLELIEQCAIDPGFNALVPLTDAQKNRRDREELVLRFFTYRDRYSKFTNRVGPFMDAFLKDMNKYSPDRLRAMEEEFGLVMTFVAKHFPHGFSKGKSNTTTPRVRYDSIAVGTALALEQKPTLEPKSLAWLDSPEFKALTTSGSSNSRPRVINRIEYVRDQLLGLASST